MSQYQDPIIAKYIELMQPKLPMIKAWFQGDPLRVPSSELPCAMISKAETRVGPFTNAEDEHGIEMQITVVTDLRQELSTDEADRKVIAGVSKLYDIIEGRQADYTLKDDSMLGVLRQNIVVNAARNLRTDLDTITRVEYGETLRDRDAGVWSIEARLLFVAHFTQLR